MNKTLEEALDEIVEEIWCKRKQNVRRLSKIHKLKQENCVLASKRKAMVYIPIAFSPLRVTCLNINFEQLNKWSEQIGKNSTKIQRLRTLISQNK